MTYVDVSPQLLRWAADRSGLGIERLRHRFPKLPEWVSREALPTMRQLEQFAKATYTPIGYLFLQTPPVEQLPIPDFRATDRERIRRPSVDLLDTIYLCQQRQEWFRDFARSEGLRDLAFVGSALPADDVVETAARIRRALGFDLSQRREDPTWTDALRRFIGQAEELGILMMVAGVVGSNNRRRLDAGEFRGFALADPVAPLIFINGSDSKAAQMFTVAHELAHIALGHSAVSDAPPSGIREAAQPEERIEHWCNQVAAELLVPLDVFRAEFRPETGWREETQRLARIFKVSGLVVLRRMFDAGGFTREAFWEAYRSEVERIEAMPAGSGGDFYLTLGARVGKRFSRAVVTSTLEGRSTFTDAFRLLGFRKMTTFRALVREFGMWA